MSAIHVSVTPRPESAPSAALAPLYGLFDVIVDGVNLTARLGEGQALALLAELGQAVASLALGRRERATVQLYTEDQLWELGLEADGADVLLTVFRAGSCPEVAIHEHRTQLEALRAALETSIAELARGDLPETVRLTLRAAGRLLAGACPSLERAPVRRVREQLGGRPTRSLSFGGSADFRCCPDAPSGQLERADLHALLVKGSFELTVRGKTLRLGQLHLVLLGEQLTQLADELLDAWQLGRPIFRRLEADGLRLSVRRGNGDVPLTLTLSGADATSQRLSFPELEPTAVVAASLRWVRSLIEAIVRHDPSQRRNLRLSTLSATVAALAERADDLTANDAQTNPEPDRYRAFPPPSRLHEARGPWAAGGKMRLSPRWMATVPNIDLSALFLCGDKLVVGSARETAALDRASGTLLWRASTQRAAVVATPSGIVRLHPEGRVTLHELETGDPRFSVQLAPRTAGGASGAVVNTAGLPKLLVVAEGDRRVTALDLLSGDVRWRYTAKLPAGYRVRRAGKLLLVAGGDSALVALDVATGEVVWRARDRQPFSGEVTVDNDATFALGGGPHPPAKLHHFDSITGERRWSVELEERPAAPPLVTTDTVMVPTKDRRGHGLTAFDRDTGAPLWRHAPGLCPGVTGWLAFDDLLVANSASGLLLCLQARTGETRYSHVFSRHLDADQPRRLEPVLRAGALFVPQHQVHVVRPADGEIIGVVPSDLIPDALRVDERCEVTIAEESGHVAVFGAAARLSLVR